LTCLREGFVVVEKHVLEVEVHVDIPLENLFLSLLKTINLISNGIEREHVRLWMRPLMGHKNPFSLEKRTVCQEIQGLFVKRSVTGLA